MNRLYIGIFAAAFLSFAACTVEPLPTEGPSMPADDGLAAPIAGELMVKFSPEVADILEKTQAGPRTRAGVPTVDEVLDLVGGYELERVFPVNRKTEENTRAAGLHQWYLVKFSDEHTPEQVADRLSKLGEVQKTSFNRKIMRAYNTDMKVTPLSARAVASMASSSEYPYNDPLMPIQWDMINRGNLFPGVDGTKNKAVAGADVQVENAWKMSTGDPSIIVAVLDEGVAVDHPDLKPNLWVNEDEIWRSREDNDGNGYAGDYYGYNFVKRTGVISCDDIYDSGHACHVAGVIAAQNNNGIGMGSIAGGTPSSPGVKIMSCQIFLGNLMSDSYSSIQAIKYATDNGATVLQCSWGYVSGKANAYDWGSSGFPDEETWATYCPLEKEVLDYFIHRAGSPNGPIEGGIAVFAAGNESAPMAGFPGAASMCVSVAATAADYTPAIYTNYGPGTSISAPGGDQNYYYEYMGHNDVFGGELKLGELGCILSCLPKHVSESGYGYMEGTSMACPHVSGVVALGLSYAAQLKKHFTVEEFKELLYSSTTDLNEYMAGNKNYYKYAVDVGLNQPMYMNLADYRNMMGAGQVNAAKFLEAIAGEDAGTPVKFPNIYVAPGAEVAVVPSAFFDGGLFIITIDDESVATYSISGTKLIIKGVKAGMTKATISVGSVSQDFTITVREAGNSGGWL